MTSFGERIITRDVKVASRIVSYRDGYQRSREIRGNIRRMAGAVHITVGRLTTRNNYIRLHATASPGCQFAEIRAGFSWWRPVAQLNIRDARIVDF